MKVQAAITVALLLAQAQRPPQPAAPPNVVTARQQFQGTTDVRVNERTSAVRLDIRSWSIVGKQRVSALELPFRGLVIVELRAGSVTTIIDGRRAERRTGDIWSVPAGSTMQLETGDDTASLQTTTIAN